MPGRRGRAPGAGAAGECIHRSACRSERRSIACRQCQIPRGSTRARRTEPQQPAQAHRLLQPAAHCQLPARCRCHAQPRPPRFPSSLTPTARPFLCAGAPEAATARIGQVSFAHLQNAHRPMDWRTAQRAHTAPPAPKGVQSLFPAPPRCHPSQPSAAQQPRAAAPPIRGVPMHHACCTPMCAAWGQQQSGFLGCSRVWALSVQGSEGQGLILGSGTGLARHPRARVLCPGEGIQQL